MTTLSYQGNGSSGKISLLSIELENFRQTSPDFQQRFKKSSSDDFSTIQKNKIIKNPQQIAQDEDDKHIYSYHSPITKTHLNPNRVKVIVSGCIFLTTLETLTWREPSSVFSRKLSSFYAPSYSSSSSSSQPNSSPHYSELIPELIFHRNPEIFLVILNYLRTGQINTSNKSFDELVSLKKEALSYNCQKLVQKLEWIILQQKNKHTTTVEPKESEQPKYESNEESDDLIFQFEEF
eukprot:c12927_g1_i1.p1 GENE.c12927_g1_i1~~c12927_g1_i1.p1  ORF type:complete len:244 (+),score=62.81 c12927_g1_i1:27-734(+)